MGRFNYLKSSFLLGEVSPKMLSHSDEKEYIQMCSEVTNALILKQGGATRRPGSQYILSSINSIALTSATRIIPFSYSKTENYAVILFPGSLGINSGSANCQIGMAFYNINSGVVSYSCMLVGAISPGIINGLSVTGGYKTFTGFVGADDINATQYAQSGDVLVLTGHGQVPIYIKRIGTDYFEIYDQWSSKAAFPQTRTAYTGSVASIQQKLSASSSPANASVWYNTPYRQIFGFESQTIALSSAAVGVANITYASPNQITLTNGDIVRVDASGSSGFAVVTGNGATCSVLKAFADTGAHTYTVSPWTHYGFPQTCVFYQQRLIFGGNAQFPDTFWGSQQGDFMEMMVLRPADDAKFTDISNDRPFEFTLAQNEINQIRWLSADKDLYVGTSGGEWIATGPDPALSLGPLNIAFNLQTQYGSENVQAKNSDGTIHFVARGGIQLRELIYEFRENKRIANDLNYYAEHISKKSPSKRATFLPAKIIQLAYQAMDNITWCVDTNYCLFGITRDRRSDVQAWHWQEMGGLINTTEIPKVLSVCSLPAPNNDSDELWLAVQRTINGTDTVFIEKMGKPYRLTSVINSSTDIQNKLVLGDCSVLQRLGSPGNTFNGFTHLKNTAVDCLADGFYLGQITVDNSGTITLPGPTTYTELIAGLPFNTRIRPVPVSAGSIMGSADSTPKRIDRVIMRFENTIRALFGKTDDATLEAIEFRDTSLANGTPTPMFTGVKRRPYAGPMEEDADILLKCDQSLPFTITGLTYRGTTYEG